MLNTFISTPLTTIKTVCNALTVNQRMGIALAGMVLCLGITAYTPNFAAGLVVTGMGIWLTKEFISRLRILWPNIFPLLKNYTSYLYRLSNSLFVAPPALEFLYVAALLLISVSIPFTWFFREMRGISYVGNIFFGFLCLAGVLDLSQQVFRFTRLTWAKTIGKVFLAFIGSVLLYVSSSIAKQITHGITLTDPQHFPDFVGWLTAMAMPALYIFSGIAFLAAWTLCLYALAAIAVLVHLSKEFVLTQLELLKLRPRTVCRPNVNWLIVATRMGSMIVALFFISETYSGLFFKNEKYITNHLEKILVMMEYRKQGECTNLNPGEKYSYLDDEKISVATSDHDGYRFSSRICSKE